MGRLCDRAQRPHLPSHRVLPAVSEREGRALGGSARHIRDRRVREPLPRLRARSAGRGVRPASTGCEVVVYTPEHELTLAHLPTDRVRLLVDVWADRYRELGSRAEVAYVYIFENKGEEVGVTLHHPHGQIYALPFVPPFAQAELEASGLHLETSGRCLHCEEID